MILRLPPYAGLHRLPRLGWLLLLWLLVAPAWADRFEVSGPGPRLEGDGYWLDARIDYRFSEAALEALRNGVPLYLDVRVQIRRRGAWFWERPLLDRKLRYAIRYQPLSELYQVNDLQAETQLNFATRQAALADLGDLSGLELVAPDALDPEASYLVRLRSSLDVGALPLPMQPLAYLSPSWALESDWHSWSLEP